MESPIERYEFLLYKANQTLSQKIIPNDQYIHSISAYERIFWSCNESITILARGVKNQILDNLKVLNSVDKFLSNSSAKLEVILRMKDEDDFQRTKKSLFIQKILEYKDQVEISFYQGDDSWLSNLGSVTVGDGRIYRYRYLQKKSDYDKTSKADVCFNDEEKVALYKEKIIRSKKILVFLLSI
jgi:hypothetical protein